MSMPRLLPEQFESLEPYAEKWTRPTDTERYSARLNSTMQEMQQFYDAMFAKGEEILEYLDSRSLDDLPDEDLNLLRMFYSLIVVSFPIEVYHQPNIPDTGAAELHFDIEAVP